MEDKKELARQLYFAGGRTQRQIALEVGVSERTIYTWIHEHAWNTLKRASCQAPATIAENLSSQLVELQNAIAAREPGKRYPTQQEADITRKLILCIEAMKKTTSLSQNMQMMESFRDYVRPLNAQFTKQLAHYSNRFLETKPKNGYAPYQMEYGIDMQAAVAPFYEELDGDQPCDLHNPPDYSVPCTDIADCTKETGCIYPFCKANAPVRNDPRELAKIGTPWQPVSRPLPPMPKVESEEEEKPQKHTELAENKCIELLPVTSPNRKEPEANPQFPKINTKAEHNVTHSTINAEQSQYGEANSEGDTQAG